MEKLQLIRQEIERRMELLKKLKKNDFTDGSIDAYKGILMLIDSLKESSHIGEGEMASSSYDPDYLQSCIDKATESWKSVDVDKFMDDMRGRETVTNCHRLAEEIDAVSKRYPEVSFAKLSRIAKHFAEWQVKKLRKNCDIIDRKYAKAMQESAYEKGRTDMREQMMKEAKPINPKYISDSALDGIKKGDKCYLLVFKYDESGNY